MKNEVIVKMAGKYGISVKNLLLAYLLNLGITPIVTVEEKGEIKEFLKSKDIVLEEGDVNVLIGLNEYKTKHFEGVEVDFKSEA